MKIQLLIISTLLSFLIIAFSAFATGILNEGSSYVIKCNDPNSSLPNSAKLGQVVFKNVKTALYNHQGMKVLLPAS